MDFILWMFMIAFHVDVPFFTVWDMSKICIGNAWNRYLRNSIGKKDGTGHRGM